MKFAIYFFHQEYLDTQTQDTHLHQHHQDTQVQHQEKQLQHQDQEYQGTQVQHQSLLVSKILSSLYYFIRNAMSNIELERFPANIQEAYRPQLFSEGRGVPILSWGFFCSVQAYLSPGGGAQRCCPALHPKKTPGTRNWVPLPHRRLLMWGIPPPPEHTDKLKTL